MTFRGELRYARLTDSNFQILLKVNGGMKIDAAAESAATRVRDNGALLTKRHLLIVALYLVGADEILARSVFAVIDECSCNMCFVAATTRALLRPPPTGQHCGLIFDKLDVIC